jgi:hypothetical protein
MRVRDGHQHSPALAGKLIVPVHRANSEPGRCPSLIATFATITPWRDQIRASPSRKLVANGVLRRHLHHRLGDMLHQPRHAPVRVMVCH